MPTYSAPVDQPAPQKKRRLRQPLNANGTIWPLGALRKYAPSLSEAFAIRQAWGFELGISPFSKFSYEGFGKFVVKHPQTMGYTLLHNSRGVPVARLMHLYLRMTKEMQEWFESIREADEDDEEYDENWDWDLDDGDAFNSTQHTSEQADLRTDVETALRTYDIVKEYLVPFLPEDARDPVLFRLLDVTMKPPRCLYHSPPDNTAPTKEVMKQSSWDSKRIILPEDSDISNDDVLSFVRICKEYNEDRYALLKEFQYATARKMVARALKRDVELTPTLRDLRAAERVHASCK